MPSTPSSHASGAAAARAASSAVRFASEPPCVSTPPAPSPHPTRSVIHSITTASMALAAGPIS